MPQQASGQPRLVLLLAMLTEPPLSSQYGEVLNLVLSSKKAGTAVVEFATVKAAVSAM